MLGNLGIDYDWRRASVAGWTVELTATEYELLRAPSVNTEWVASYDALLRRVWVGRDNGDFNAVRAFVKQLRQKLGDDAANPAWTLDEHSGRLRHGASRNALRPLALPPDDHAANVCRAFSVRGRSGPAGGSDEGGPAATAASIRACIPYGFAAGWARRRRRPGMRSERVVVRCWSPRRLYPRRLASPGTGADPILTMEISNLPEIVRVYTTLCR